MPAEEIAELYEGLRQSHLNDYNVLLSGYMPTAACIEAVGKIGRDLRFNAGTKPGSFFWGTILRRRCCCNEADPETVLDPVMGDDGRLYIPEEEVPAYKELLREADLILPNQFEAEYDIHGVAMEGY